jgi:hypothetical protein
VLLPTLGRPTIPMVRLTDIESTQRPESSQSAR